MTNPDTTATPRLRLVALLAVGSGAVVANLYYAQPLIGMIAPDLGLGTGIAGLTVTLTQLGYGAGLLFVASLADLIENRRLVLACLAASIAGLLAVALSEGPVFFLVASFAVGMSSVATQVLVPLAGHLAPDQVRGRVVGNVMAGLLAGIMLARPAASLIASFGGWRAVFVAAALLLALLWLVLARALPRRHPAPGLRYRRILLTMLELALTERVLQKRALYQALMFAAFNLFWTAIPLVLAHRFGFGQRGIAWFALAGAGGALAAPVAGRLADRGQGDRASGFAMAVLAIAFLASFAATRLHDLVLLTVATIALDAAVQVNQVCGQRAIYALAPELRGRLNAVYVGLLFAGGASGSIIGTALYASRGFAGVAVAGAAIGVAALSLFGLLRGSSGRRRP